MLVEGVGTTDRVTVMPGAIARARTRLDMLSALHTFMLVFGSLLVLYLVTMARFDYESGTDTVASALPAWRLAQFGDIDLSNFAQLPWIGEINGTVMSNRTPGVSFIAAPLYWLFGSAKFSGVVPSMLPASATAALLSAGAVATLHLALRRIVAPAMAVGAALIFGVATSTWSISANELWPHGPAQFFLALGMLGLIGKSHLAAGVAYGSALLIRPVTAIIAAVSGLYLGWKTRSWRPIMWVALGTGFGLGLLLLYNGLVLGSWSPTPPSYGAGFVTRAGRQGLLAYGGDVVAMLAHPNHGLLVFSPFLLFTLPGLRRAWQAADPWVKASALAGLVYMLIHLRLNRFSGGLLYGYRYPLEMLIVMAPLLLLSWQAWFKSASLVMRRLFYLAVAASILRQAYSIWIGYENPWLL